MNAFLALPAVFAAACSSGTEPGFADKSSLSGSSSASARGPERDAGANASGENDAPDSGPWLEATHAPPPQIQNNPGQSGQGPVLATPVFTAITFPGYDLTTDVERFVSTLGSTSYWAAAVGSYGVGTPTVSAPVRISDAPPATLDDGQIRDWLSRELTTTSDLPPATESSVYILFYPRSVTLTAFGETGCTDGGFGGYHYSMKVNGEDVTFVVLPECDSGDAAAPLIRTTLTASHEIAEAVTDPHPESEPTTWQRVDPDHLVWELALGGNGEVGDMCERAPGADFVPGAYGFTVQRIWSNASAAAGHDPCQPALPGQTVYFNAAPLLPDRVSILPGSARQSTAGVKIGVGATGTVEVDLFSDGPSPAWTVTAEDLSRAGNLLTFSWKEGAGGKSATGNNGDRLHLDIHVAGADPAYAGNVFRITSRLGSTTNEWYGFVGQE